jgi:hypothetical protein
MPSGDISLDKNGEPNHQIHVPHLPKPIEGKVKVTLSVQGDGDFVLVAWGGDSLRGISEMPLGRVSIRKGETRFQEFKYSDNAFRFEKLPEFGESRVMWYRVFYKAGEVRVNWALYLHDVGVKNGSFPMLENAKFEKGNLSVLRQDNSVSIWTIANPRVEGAVTVYPIKE